MPRPAADSRRATLPPISSANENRKQAQRFGRILQHSGRMLLASDAAALLLAFLCGGFIAWAVDIYALKGSFQTLLSPDTLRQFIIFTGLGALALVWLDMKGHYRQRLPFWESISHILTVAFFGFVVCGFIQFVAQATFSRLWLGLSWVLFGLFIFAGRALVRNMLEKSGQWRIPAILVGHGPSAKAALQALKREPRLGFAIVAQVSPEKLSQLVAPQGWSRLMRTQNASHIFLALEGGEMERHQPALKSLVRERLPFSIVPPWRGLPSGTMSPHHFMLHDVMLLHNTNRLSLPLPCFLKRGFDIAVSASLLLVAWPFFLLLALIIRSDGGPAFFRQQRIGRNGRTFTCYKFRSMRVDAEECLSYYLAANPDAAEEWQTFQKLKNDVRITAFGQFLRRSSIDEVPQLINVLKGDMSLVGPRPIMLGQEDFYADDLIFYESVRPGVTGPWQVSGRNTLTFNERVTLEAYYARNWNLWMDIVILLKTIPTLLTKEQAF